ncbi:PilZ domain-containing protein [Alteromonadaceae bacterium Bs31]|nr:PilZ domain-containing protein [Alteromonadaceae bacterium Bs31]
MSEERRRYFRINETMGIGYEALDHTHVQHSEHTADPRARMADILDVVEEQDERIEHLLVELEDDHPKVVELISLFNQKLERVVRHLLVDSQLINRIARKMKEVNISACGIAFMSDEAIAVGTNLHLELALYPGNKTIETPARVVSCDQEEEGGYYWRLDYFGMAKGDQEALIQHIVRSQSIQLKNK